MKMYSKLNFEIVKITAHDLYELVKNNSEIHLRLQPSTISTRKLKIEILEITAQDLYMLTKH